MYFSKHPFQSNNVRIYISILCLASPVVQAWTIPPEYALYGSKNGHYFQTSDGQPFFWQADTAWTMINRLNYSEAEQYLSDRASKGFNIVQACGAHFAGPTALDRQGNPTFVDGDYSKPNEEFWKYVDSIVELAWKYGIRIVLHTAWGNYVHDSAGKPGYFDAPAAKAFGIFVGKRYPYLPKILFGDTNPWWKNKTAVSTDYAYGGLASNHLPTEYPLTDFSAVYNAFAEGIIEGEHSIISNHSHEHHYEPMISIHPTNQWFLGGPLALASSFFGDTKWLTFDISQSGHSDFPPNPPIPWWSCRRGWEPAELMWSVGESAPGRKRPAIENEAHYEWRYNNAKRPEYWNASDVRTGTWQTVFAGMAGLTYGANTVWQMAIPGLFEADNSGPKLAWYDAINLPGSSQMQWVQKAILDRGNGTYFNRIPAQDIIVGDAGISDARIAATRDAEGSWLMVYSPNATFTIDTKSLKGCDIEARWFSPVSGQYTSIEYTQCGNATIHQFTLPVEEDHKDWTLVLEQGQS
ncbi:hypothetical protein P280DRAFT_458547 [Massarina eburnea CBS 473.64]|uniref:DUF4038 domain-containing protein n=1 Tax=Massarina eburnea CBS 473.64 TaxID=1395130 RepID=A0A6A6RTF4_9PLEO|nr:hypothetical protein P280DRAFT_458547 [Massarina eburnea CBS 473.64]